MHLGLHLPHVDLDGTGLSRDRLIRAAGAARAAGFGSLCANDHLRFRRPWLDGLVALTAAADAGRDLELVTTVALPALRHPRVLAGSLAALDVLSGGRVVAGIGAGSSREDYDAVGVPFEERWQRLDESAAVLRHLLRGGPRPEGLRHYPVPDEPLDPPPARRGGIPLWLGSWGSPAGLRRVARYGDGWLASAYNTDPETFAAARTALPPGLPAAVVSMWTWVTEDAEDARRAVDHVLAPALGRDPDELRDRVCVGPAGRCAELVARYADAGCDRLHFWPLGDEERQIGLIAGLVSSAT
jgi:alkanesulfonate monooxygenase SsuD/methylene tetrahydromethanopterin reductase-like flavin-dependent oxidoreductase (luciferase family)